MTKEQLKLCINFSEMEIKRTGGKLEGIDFDSFFKLQKLRELIKKPIHFQKNGINSGLHVSKEHAEGKAFDFYVNGFKDFSLAYEVFKLALEVGFKGIGIYWNGNMYSFHLDTREKYSFWGANKVKDVWIYKNLIFDPRGK